MRKLGLRALRQDLETSLVGASGAMALLDEREMETLLMILDVRAMRLRLQNSRA